MIGASQIKCKTTEIKKKNRNRLSRILDQVNWLVFFTITTAAPIIAAHTKWPPKADHPLKMIISIITLRSTVWSLMKLSFNIYPAVSNTAKPAPIEAPINIPFKILLVLW